MNKVTLIIADVLAGLAMLPDESVHCCVTSPPYWGLRDYGVSCQIGLEPTIEEFVQKMVDVFREVRRVLRPDGVLFLNLGDTYAASRPYQVVDNKHRDVGNKIGHAVPPGLKPKDLCGVPWRVALALQNDGWWLRSDIIWAKPNPMPESCTDRPTTAHEHIFLLTKSAKYYWGAEAVREIAVEGTDLGLLRGKNAGGPGKDKIAWHAQSIKDRQEAGINSKVGNPTGLRNLRNVWTIATAPFPSAHFATFPPAIPERCIKAGTSEKGCCPNCGAPWKRVVEKKGGTTGKSWHDHKEDLGRGQRGGDDGHNAAADLYKTYSVTTTGWSPTCGCCTVESEAIPCTVLDIFSGAGTTALVAAKLGRDAIGIELNPEYVEMSRKRIAGELGMLAKIEIREANHV